MRKRTWLLLKHQILKCSLSPETTRDFKECKGALDGTSQIPLKDNKGIKGEYHTDDRRWQQFKCHSLASQPPPLQ